MLRNTTLMVLLAFFLSACATIPPKNPEAEVKFRESNEAIEILKDETALFYTDTGDVLERITILYASAGWPEFEAILKEYSSPSSKEGEAQDDSKIADRLERWGKKWNSSGEDTYNEYLSLAQRCGALELRRLKLRVKVMATEAKVISAMAMELSAGRQSQAELMEKTLQTLTGFEDELNSYVINEIDLYEIVHR